MHRIILIAGVVALVGALVYFFTRESSSPAPSESRYSTSAEDQSAQSGPAIPRRAQSPQGTPEAEDPAAPIRIAGDTADLGEELAPERRYVRDDGTEVRDHRAEASEPNLGRRATLPRALSKVQPETLVAVRTAIRPAMKGCIAAANAKPGARVQAVLTVSIKQELLRVDKLQIQTEGMTDDEDFRACVTEKILAHEEIVKGAQDVDAHAMTFPYDL